MKLVLRALGSLGLEGIKCLALVAACVVAVMLFASYPWIVGGVLAIAGLSIATIFKMEEIKKADEVSAHRRKYHDPRSDR